MIKNTHIPKSIREDIITKYPLNSSQREAVYLWLVLNFGEKCSLCNSVPGEDEKLEIDHIDGNKYHHYYKNLQLLCKKCNCNKDKKGSKKGIDLVVCVSEKMFPQEARNLETALKLRYYPEFINYITDKFKKGSMLIDIQDMASNLFVRTGGSDETFRRYAKNLCGTEGPCKIYEDVTTKKKYLQLKQDSELYKKYMN